MSSSAHGDGEHAADGSDLILSLPDDVLALISAHLLPRDLLALSASSRRLHRALSAADKAWLAQSRRLLPSPSHLLAWRAAVGDSSIAVCRFLHSASPLLGLWAHQNPELGNLVAAFPGFLSLVAVRSIPQELSPHLLWAPVFELLADAQGHPALLFLHGQDGQHPGSLFPGFLSSLHPHANTLLLEAHTPQAPIPSSQFPHLAFGDRRRLLDALVAACRVTLPPELATAPLFARSEEDLPVLAARREALLRLHSEASGGMVRRPEVEAILLGAKKMPPPTVDTAGDRIRLRKSFSAIAGYVKNGLRQIVTRSVSANSRAEYADSKHLALDDFLLAGDSVGLCLRGARMRLSTYRAWPSMHDNWFALYKLKTQAPLPGREYAGLWGGTFGWPPGRPEDERKPGKALFFLLLSYELDGEGKLLLIATKVLEGTHYVVHPNGSSMFIVRMGESSTEAFPWQTDEELRSVDIQISFAGEGIATGYGFRYPGSKPGSLFVLQDGRLAFVWRDNKAVLTLRRLNLEEMLRKGERVPSLAPIPNFAYLTKSYSNVFTVFHGSASCSSSPRFFPTKRNKQAWELHKQVHKLILEIVKESGEDRNLLRAILHSASSSKVGLAEAENFIVDNCKSIYFAGYESTAATAAWCLMLLGLHPEWQDRVREEVQEICGGQPVDSQSLQKMKNLTMVIQETLRLYPAGAFVSRQALQELKLGGVHIPKGVNIYIPVSTMHLDPQLWGPDVKEFNPERFSNARPQLHSYLPFGAGARTCLGQGFAMAELKILISLIISRFVLKLSPHYEHSPTLKLIVEPEFGVDLTLMKVQSACQD